MIAFFLKYVCALMINGQPEFIYNEQVVKVSDPGLIQALFSEQNKKVWDASLQPHYPEMMTQLRCAYIEVFGDRMKEVGACSIENIHTLISGFYNAISE